MDGPVPYFEALRQQEALTPEDMILIAMALQRAVAVGTPVLHPASTFFRDLDEEPPALQDPPPVAPPALPPEPEAQEPDPPISHIPPLLSPLQPAPPPPVFAPPAPYDPHPWASRPAGPPSGHPRDCPEASSLGPRSMSIARTG